MPSAAVMIGISALSHPLKDLYEKGKSRFNLSAAKWTNQQRISMLVTKLRAYEKVRTIWQRDREVRLSQFYYPSRIVTPAGARQSVNSLADFSLTENFVIQGSVGQGKSIFLRYLCVQELAAKSTQRIPLFLELRHLSSERTLKKALYDVFESLDFEINDDLFSYYAESGSIVALLDEFDELEEGLVAEVIRQLEEWSVRFPRFQFFVTSRPSGEIQKSASFKVLTLSPLQPADYRPFMDKIGVEPSLRDLTLAAIARSSADIKGLISSPLLLTLLILVYKNEGNIPDELPEFFKLLFATVFSRHDNIKPGFRRPHKSKLSERQLERLFEAFCFAATTLRFNVALSLDQFNTAFSRALVYANESCEIDGFMYDIIKVSCLIQEDGLYFSFLHKSLLDYFSAAFIRNRTEMQAAAIYSALCESRVHWRATLSFLVEIDRYRFGKYFAIPAIEQTLRRFRALDAPATDADLRRGLDEIFPPASCVFTFVREPSGGSIRQTRFGSYQPIDSMFFQMIMILAFKSLDLRN